MNGKSIKEAELPSTYETMVAGGIAGSIGKTVTAPLSRLTILYQVGPLINVFNNDANNSSLASHIKPNDSLITNARRLIQKEGILSMWRGNLTTVIHRFPYSAINFTTFEFSKKIILEHMGYHETPFFRFVCGALSGAVACFVCYPLDLVKTRLTVGKATIMEVENKKNYFIKNVLGSSQILSNMLQILNTEGLSGLYRGLTVSLLVTVPNLAIGFSTYGTMKEKLLQHGGIFERKRSGHLSPLGALVSGSMSGILSSLITFPIDTLRRRMQMNNLDVQYQQKHVTHNSKINSMLRDFFLKEDSVTKFFMQHNNYDDSKTFFLQKNYANLFKRNATSTSKKIPLSVFRVMAKSNILSFADFINSNSNNKNNNNNNNNVKNFELKRKHEIINTVNSNNNKFSLLSYFSHLIKKEGIRGLYRGLLPELLKVTPMISITFLTYEFSLEILHPSYKEII
jgi:hypothetical protein